MSFEANLLAILVRLGAISSKDAADIEQSFHDSDVDQFEDYLLSENIVDEENLLEALSQHYQVPSFDVVGYFFERHYLNMFPKDILLRNSMIPLEVEGNVMVMVAGRPDSADLLSTIGEHVSYDIQFNVGIGLDICDAVKEFYDKSDTEEAQDEDIREEHALYGEFEESQDEDAQMINFSLDLDDSDGDSFEE